MARPIYQYKPIEDSDSALGILLPFNKDAKGKSVSAAYNSTNHSGKGVFESSYSTQEAVVSNLKNLILTAKGERYMQPNFGTNIQSILFENNTDDMKSLLQETIEQDVQYWLPYVQLKEVVLKSSDDMHTIGIKLTFRIDTIGANVVINVLANENALQIESVEQGDRLEQVGTFGSDTAFNTGLGGSY
jgi:phage baseplate assembly protein W|tara:strand:- start:25449 stop:26012 length:564 start_codon:yes stop_codon:yes gene_type:complete